MRTTGKEKTIFRDEYGYLRIWVIILIVISPIVVVFSILIYSSYLIDTELANSLSCKELQLWMQFEERSRWFDFNYLERCVKN